MVSQVSNVLQNQRELDSPSLQRRTLIYILIAFVKCKSLAQAIQGDMEGALETQENFSKRCVVVSQLRSAVEAALGDMTAAEKTQQEFIKIENIAPQAAVVGAAVLTPVIVVASVAALVKNRAMFYLCSNGSECFFLLLPI